MNQRFKTLRKAKETDNPELWTLYRRLRNQVTHDVRLAKSKYYRELFDVVKDSRSYWKLVRNATNANKASPIVGIRGTDGKLETSDVTKAEILNEHFSSIGERLAKDLPALNTDNVHTYIHHSSFTLLLGKYLTTGPVKGEDTNRLCRDQKLGLCSRNNKS